MILICLWRIWCYISLLLATVNKKSFRAQAYFENGATSYNLRIARAQINYYKSLSVPEREEYIEQYLKNIGWFPKYWQMVLLQVLSISIGFVIGFIIKLFV